MSDSLTYHISEIARITRQWFPSRSDSSAVYRHLVSLARLSGYPETYDDDLNGMRAIVQALGQDEGIALVVSIPTKLGSSEWYEYAARIILEYPGSAANQGLNMLMSTRDPSYREAVQRVIRRR